MEKNNLFLIGLKSFNNSVECLYCLSSSHKINWTILPNLCNYMEILNFEQL